MMEEDKEEIQDVLTVEVLKEKKHASMKQFRIKIPPDEQGATIDLEDLNDASRQIATDWAFSDTVMWIMENQDDIYVQPRRILAARWIQGRVRAHRWHLNQR